MNSRKAPFTAFEKEYLKKLIEPHSAVLESRRTDADLNRRRLKLWSQITTAYNNCSKCKEATTQQLKKLWLNMRAKARYKSLQATGGPTPDMSSEHDSSLAKASHITPTIKVPKSEEDEPNEDNDEMIWVLKRAHSRSPIEHSPDDSKTYRRDSFTDTRAYEFMTLSDSPPASPNVAHATRNLSIDALKNKMLENDIEHREIRFQIEMENLQKTNDLKYKMLLLEYEHKKKLFQLIEREQQRKLRCNPLFI